MNKTIRNSQCSITDVLFFPPSNNCVHVAVVVQWLCCVCGHKQFPTRAFTFPPPTIMAGSPLPGSCGLIIFNKRQSPARHLENMSLFRLCALCSCSHQSVAGLHGSIIGRDDTIIISLVQLNILLQLNLLILMQEELNVSTPWI